jgi:hypothetical protein
MWTLSISTVTGRRSRLHNPRRCLQAGDRPMIALDVDEPLWHLSRNGCTLRDPENGACPKRAGCPVADLCWPGRIKVGTRVELRT